jgi:hypothetical protein
MNTQALFPLLTHKDTVKERRGNLEGAHFHFVSNGDEPNDDHNDSNKDHSENDDEGSHCVLLHRWVIYEDHSFVEGLARPVKKRGVRM